jgi:putative DNA methylase
MIESALHKGANGLHHYNLHAYAIMANHVHILISPQVPLSTIMKAIKGVTARNANKLLNRTGKVFWQDESFDHWTRDEAEDNKIRRYIENNPVRARLVARAEDWPWSSATSVKAAQAGVPVLPAKT